MRDSRLKDHKQIHLFLAKYRDRWLEYNSHDEKMLVLGDVTSNVRSMLAAGEIDSEAAVGELFGKVPPARCMHVVVTVFQDASYVMHCGILGKNRVQGHWDDMDCIFRHLKPSPDKPVSLNTLCWDDVSWLYRRKHHEEMACTVSDGCFQHVKTKLNEATNALSGVNTSWILFALFMGIVSTSVRRMKIYGNRYFENPDGKFDVGLSSVL